MDKWYSKRERWPPLGQDECSMGAHERRRPITSFRMPHPSWNDSYASGESLPWDTGTPDPLLVEVIESRAITPGRTELRSTEFTVCDEQLKSWLCLSRKRTIAAQPSTRR